MAAAGCEEDDQGKIAEAEVVGIGGRWRAAIAGGRAKTITGGIGVFGQTLVAIVMVIVALRTGWGRGCFPRRRTARLRRRRDRDVGLMMTR